MVESLALGKDMVMVQTVKDIDESALDLEPWCEGQAEKDRTFAVLLEQHREEIVASWMAEIRALAGTHYADLPDESLRLSLGTALQVILQAEQTASCAELQSYLDDLCRARLQAGFDSGEVIQSLLLCNKAALSVMRRAYPRDPVKILALMSRLDAYTRRIARYWTDVYVAETEKRLEEQQARTALMLDTLRTAGSTLALDDVLARVARAITKAVGVPHCVVVVVDEDRQVASFRRAGVVERPVLEVLAGYTIQDYERPFDELADFTWQMMRERQPIVAHDARNDPRLRGFPGFGLIGKSVLGLPFVVMDRVVALAWVMTWEDYHTFTREEIDLARGIANAAALAIENARLYQTVRGQAILEERQRLSREVHDNLSQALGLVKLKSALAAESLAAQRLDQVEAALHEMHDIAAEAYTDAREEILGLRSIWKEEKGFLPALQRYLAHYRAGFGLDVEFEADEEGTLALAPQAGAQALRIIHEALSNVRKHARTDKARVRVEKAGIWARIEISDAGQGFNAARFARPGGNGVGLQVMRERAQSIGGFLKVESESGRGTRVLVWVPEGDEQEEVHGAAARSPGG